jgi:ribosomal protein S18 acetylase RimI-like enzyme
MQFRLFFHREEKGFQQLFVLEFTYDRETDWYEARVFRGSQVIGYVHGYANRGWTPQVNNIWVDERYRRRGIGSFMMAKVEDAFGQIPLPATPIEDNDAARGFWKNYLKMSWVRKTGERDGQDRE